MSSHFYLAYISITAQALFIDGYLSLAVLLRHFMSCLVKLKVSGSHVLGESWKGRHPLTRIKVWRHSNAVDC